VRLEQCSICGEGFNPAVVSMYREVTGWEKLRDQGGANSITLRKETGLYACKPCIERRQRGREGQGSLL
jgi:hypothetical protein